MRTVFSNSELAHKWFHANMEHGRTGNGNFYFQNDVIYSYGDHYPIARKFTVENYNVTLHHNWSTRGSGIEERDYLGYQAVLFNCESSSPTTEGKHKKEVRRAIPSPVPVFTVPVISRYQAVRLTEADGTLKIGTRAQNEISQKQSDKPMHDANIKWYEEQCIELWQRPTRERKGLAARRLRRYICQLSEMIAYLQIFKGTSWAGHLHRIPASLQMALNELDAALPAEQAHNEACAAKRNERRRNGGMSTASLEERIAAFRDGKPLRGTFLVEGNALLRLKGDTVQTSQGVLFPRKHAQLAIGFLQKLMYEKPACKHVDIDGFDCIHVNGLCTIWQKNGHSIHLGSYQIDRVMCDGTIHAGCHNVKWEEIERLNIELVAVLTEEVSNNG